MHHSLNFLFFFTSIINILCNDTNKNPIKRDQQSLQMFDDAIALLYGDEDGLGLDSSDNSSS
jgi:hypothetical protein